jgi:hypothetical protein
MSLLREVANVIRHVGRTALEALARGAGLETPAGPRRDLCGVAGTWVEDPDFDRALVAQHGLDRDLWL